MRRNMRESDKRDAAEFLLELMRVERGYAHQLKGAQRERREKVREVIEEHMRKTSLTRDRE